MKVKIIRADKIPNDKIKDGDIIEYFPDRISRSLVKKGIAEEYKEEAKPKRKTRAKKAE